MSSPSANLQQTQTSDQNRNRVFGTEESLQLVKGTRVSDSSCAAKRGGLLGEQRSEQLLRQWELERLTDGSCLFGGETASSGDTQQKQIHVFQQKQKLPHCKTRVFGPTSQNLLYLL